MSCPDSDYRSSLPPEPNDPQMPSRSSQAKYWIATIPSHGFTPYLPPGIDWIRGQLEAGAETGFVHWQLVMCCHVKRRLAWLRSTFGEYHLEPTRSAAANDYCWKQDTAIDGTKFELGELPIQRHRRADWDRILAWAKCGDFGRIPGDVMVRCYHQLRSLRNDHVQPPPMSRTAMVFWGVSGSGKSHRAWLEAGVDCYVKDPNTKWFDGYVGQPNCVIDEFDGKVSLNHILRWLDKYPVRVETKGGSVPLLVRKWFLTSNVDPRNWYIDIDPEQLVALMRRLTVVHFPHRYVAPPSYEESVELVD